MASAWAQHGQLVVDEVLNQAPVGHTVPHLCVRGGPLCRHVERPCCCCPSPKRTARSGPKILPYCIVKQFFCCECRNFDAVSLQP